MDDEPSGISWWMTPNPLFRSLLVWASLTMPVSSEPPVPSASSQVKKTYRKFSNCVLHSGGSLRVEGVAGIPGCMWSA